jgi:K+-sensing histidine kinase KdpD
VQIGPDDTGCGYNEIMTPQRRNDWLAIGAGLLLPLIVAIALIPLRDSIGNTNVALVLMAVVIGVGLAGRRAAAIVAALSAALWFDFFQTQPYYSFTINRTEDWVSVGLLLVAGLAVAELAIWGRRQRSHAERGASEVSALRVLAEMASDGESEASIQTTAAFWLRDLLHAREARFVAGDGDSEAEITRDGSVMVGNLRWATATQGLPGPLVTLAVRSRKRRVGSFMIEPTPGVPVTEDRLFVAAAIADQVGATHPEPSIPR